MFLMAASNIYYRYHYIKVTINLELCWLYYCSALFAFNSLLNGGCFVLHAHSIIESYTTIVVYSRQYWASYFVKVTSYILTRVHNIYIYIYLGEYPTSVLRFKTHCVIIVQYCITYPNILV